MYKIHQQVYLKEIQGNMINSFSTIDFKSSVPEILGAKMQF